MREIKFRAWDGEHIYISPSIEELHHLASWFEAHSKFIKSEDSIIMQYTGLKDKNGKEIYEGDIIICDNIMHSRNRPFKIVFENGMFCVYGYNKKYTPIDEFGEWCHRKVIGNIYENPELLKEQ